MVGCFEDSLTYNIKLGSTTLPEPEPCYQSNGCEADQSIWRHAILCDVETVLIIFTML